MRSRSSKSAITTYHPSICRACHNMCGVMVGVVDGRVVEVKGDYHNPHYEGYFCIKGKALPAMINHPDRLLNSRKREGGEYLPIAMDQALPEIADRLKDIVAKHGPRSVAVYAGTFGINSHPASLAVAMAFADALGTPMMFTPAPIDMPAKMNVGALHGTWMAPSNGFRDCDAALLIGSNPAVSHTPTWAGNPAKHLGAAVKNGARVIVIDPRRTETARRAWRHVQPRPGKDIALLAAIIRVILEEGLFDASFIAENARGLDELRAAVAPFTVERVAAEAEISRDDLLLTAKTYAGAKQGYIACGTGPNMAQSGTLLEYLAMNVRTLCGDWGRAGERIWNPGTLIPVSKPKAQAMSPAPDMLNGHPMRVHGLRTSLAGAPTAALPDEILLKGEGQVRALVCIGGNPAVSWPDQIKAVAALEQLELLVQVDAWMSQTARMADYVLAPRLCFEGSMTTQSTVDLGTIYGVGIGRTEAYAQYASKLVDPPAGSDVLAEWEIMYELARLMGLQLSLRTHADHTVRQPIDMGRRPTDDELIEMTHERSRIPLEEVKRYPHGQNFPDPPVFVAPKDEGWEGRFDLANVAMMAELKEIGENLGKSSDDAHPFRMISRRMNHVYNSSHNFPETNRGRRYNPAFMNPSDLTALGIHSGDTVKISSSRASVIAVAEADPTVKTGSVSISHAFGTGSNRDPSDVRQVGSSISRLLSYEQGFDRYSGQPRMSNIAVSVIAHSDTQKTA